MNDRKQEIFYKPSEKLDRICVQAKTSIVDAATQSHSALPLLVIVNFFQDICEPSRHVIWIGFQRRHQRQTPFQQCTSAYCPIGFQVLFPVLE